MVTKDSTGKVISDMGIAVSTAEPSMTPILSIPALGCDARLYGQLAFDADLDVSMTAVIASANRLEACVRQVLEGAPERFVVMGTSFGGRVALETALAVPDRIAGLIVIGASAGPSPDPAAGLRRSRRLREGEFDAVVTEMADVISHRPGPRGEATRQAMIDMCASMGGEAMSRQSEALAHRADLWPRLGEIGCPALMLWGDMDQFVPASEGLRLAQAVLHGRFVEIGECGHFPTLEYPEEASSAIDHWLRDIHLT
jgi:pimeloyl-ACP methyl ester carboxylesterase